jgi:GH25 family lysozyme M1 (1,4-beta-N-acetylmuramidase)
MSYTLGIDLNRYRAGFDIAKAKESGVRYVIAKATELWDGTKWEDPTFIDYRNQSKANELPFGAYMYWRAASDPEEQVDWFIEIAKKKLDIPPIIDVERTNNQGVLSQDNAWGSILECCLLLESFYNVPAIIYTSWYAWKVLTGNNDLVEVYPLWVANYTNYPSPLLPVPATDWEFWQFTSSYPLPGQPKTCDANRFNGNEEEFDEYVKVSRSLMYPEAPPPPPPPPPPDDGEPIYIELAGKKYVGKVKVV